MSSTRQMCSRCLLTDAYPNIEFNENGVCNHCLSFKNIEYKGKAELERLLNSYRNKGRKYDCVVPISGGKDSAFVLYQLVKVYNMKVLAYNYDSGLVDQQAKLNIKRMTESLNVKLVTFKLDQKKYLRKIILSWSRRPSPAMIPMLCLGCRYGIAHGGYKTAENNKIPLIIFGDTKGESAMYKYEFFNDNELLGVFLEMIKNPTYLKPDCISMMIKDYLHVLPYVPMSKILQLTYPNTRTIQFFDYIEWDEKEIVSTIRDNLEWENSNDIESSRRFDCKVSTLKEYLMRKHAKFTDREDQLSYLIRANALTKEEAQQILTRDTNPEKELKVIHDLLEDIGLDISDVRL